MDTQYKKDAIFLAIKNYMKLKSIQYNDLAEQLEMSVSGIKKIFREKNCSIEKLITICEVLELSLTQLLEHVEEPLFFRHLKLTVEADHYLAEHPKLFYLLRIIQTKKVDKSNLIELGFSEASLYDLRIFLYQHDLITDGTSIFTLYKTCLLMPKYKESKLRKLIVKKYGSVLYNKEIVNQEMSSGLEPIFWSQAISKKDQIILYKEIGDLLIKYQERSSVYITSAKENEKELSLLIVPSLFTPGANIEENLDQM
jgi:transcriptional regulator with XRE-family HTH domain